MAFELQVFHDAAIKKANEIGKDRIAETRVELLGQRGAANDIATLTDQNPQAFSSQVSRASESVVTAANNNGVVELSCHGLLRSNKGRSLSQVLSPRIAARRID